MIGSIVGDIVGSRYEWDNIKSKEFDFLTHECFFTDDSIMTLAICEALISCREDYSDLPQQAIKSMQEIGQLYPNSGYGSHFYQWLFSDNPKPYGSYGNGAAMRVSGCAYVSKTIDEVKKLSYAVTSVTHDHPEGIKGAEAVSVAIFLALTGKNILEIRDYIDKNYYRMDFSLESIRADYSFDVTCQGSVPQALAAFFESISFEDAIRNAISLGGDSDTIAAITGSVAEAYYGVSNHIRKHVLTFLDRRLLSLLNEFEKIYPPRIEKIEDGNSIGISSPKRSGKK